jgi:hypothetical protein
MHNLATLPPSLHRRIVEKRNTLATRQMTPVIHKELEQSMQVEFVYNSNSIEGVTLSRGEKELALRGMTVHGRNIADVLAAQNHEKDLGSCATLCLAGKSWKSATFLKSTGRSWQAS